LELVINILTESLKISLFVFVMMVAVDLLNLKVKGRLEAILKSGRRWKQYIIAAGLGVLPGCLGSFAGVSLYMHGVISFGALTGTMFATAGDEQFVMLSMFPMTAVKLFLILFIIGIFIGFATDYFVKKFNIKTRAECEVEQYHPGKKGYRHYIKDHIWKHIIKKHLFKIFVWTFGALLVIELVMQFLDLQSITSHYTLLLMLLSAFIGLIPESGPHLIFVMMFSKGLIPFSVLFTSSIVQDGHGILPLLSYSLKDSAMIKTFNFAFGLILGFALFLLGF
jgi:hypothetical protein